MTQPKIMDAAWRSYSEAVIPADAPDVQRVESRRAFYAGAQAAMAGLLSFLDPGEEPTQADLDRMTALTKELDDFARHVRQGRA
jgi:hypothetical protein